MNGRITQRAVAGRIITAILIFGVASVAAGCKNKVESQWRNGKVEIDGVNTEWSGAIHSFKDGQVLAGAMNDNEFLYLSLFLGEPQDQTHVLMQGCTFWIDPGGGEKKVFGIRFPPGEPPMKEGRARPDTSATAGDDIKTRRAVRGEQGSFSGGRRGVLDSESIREKVESLSEELEILGPDETLMRRQERGEGGIEIAIQICGETMICEIKVPLASKGIYPYAIGTSPGNEIGVGLETSQIEVPERPDREESGQGGGMSGRGGKGGGRGGKGSRGGGMGGHGGGTGRPGGHLGSTGHEIPEPLKLWVKVKLSASPNTG